MVVCCYTAQFNFPRVVSTRLQLSEQDLSGSFTACALHLVTETLLVPMLPHAFAALVLGDFCFSSFFERAHSDFLIWNRRFNHLMPGIETEFRCDRNHSSDSDGIV